MESAEDIAARIKAKFDKEKMAERQAIMIEPSPSDPTIRVRTAPMKVFAGAPKKPRQQLKGAKGSKSKKTVSVATKQPNISAKKTASSTISVAPKEGTKMKKITTKSDDQTLPSHAAPGNPYEIGKNEVKKDVFHSMYLMAKKLNSDVAKDLRVSLIKNNMAKNLDD